MVMSVALADAKKKQYRVEPDGTEKKGGVLNTPFFGSLTMRDAYEAPQAFLSQGDPGRFSTTHYHGTDQFQIVVGGKGKLGRHELLPIGVHFARAYTPYGPLQADPDQSLITFTLRSHHDPLGAQRFPEKQGALQEKSDRDPWQVFVPTVDFPALTAEGPDAMLLPVEGMKDERGLSAYTVSMKPNAQMNTADPHAGDGQYLLILKGSIVHQDRELKAYALLFIRPEEGSYQLHAGADGLQALIVNFPRPGKAGGGQQFKALNAWQCTMCAYIYDQAHGVPQEGLAPDTRWQDVPEGWSCPNCSSPKSLFRKA